MYICTFPCICAYRYARACIQARKRTNKETRAYIHTFIHTDARFAALAAIVTFSKFDGDNDPYGEHDFGALYRLASGRWTQDRPEDQAAITQTVFWKVDCYDNALTFGSEAPWDETQTKRVLTIMLASEY